MLIYLKRGKKWERGIRFVQGAVMNGATPGKGLRMMLLSNSMIAQLILPARLVDPFNVETALFAGRLAKTPADSLHCSRYLGGLIHS